MIPQPRAPGARGGPPGRAARRQSALGTLVVLSSGVGASRKVNRRAGGTALAVLSRRALGELAAELAALEADARTGRGPPTTRG